MSLHFKREMKRLKKHLMKLSNTVDLQVSQAIVALSQLDEEMAQQVIDADIEVDKKEIEIEEDCLKLLALHQPVANDLRLIITVLKINNDLERIGDHAVMIAEETIRLTTLPAVDIPDELFLLSDKAKIMLKKCMLAFIEGDLQVARSVLQSGKGIRELAENIFNSQLGLIKSSPETAEQRLYLLKVSRQIQRIADHTTNISENIIFHKSGDIIRHYSTLN